MTKSNHELNTKGDSTGSSAMVTFDFNPSLIGYQGQQPYMSTKPADVHNHIEKQFDQIDTMEKKMLPCRFFLQGNCSRGRNCILYHPALENLETAIISPPLPDELGSNDATEPTLTTGSQRHSDMERKPLTFSPSDGLMAHRGPRALSSFLTSSHGDRHMHRSFRPHRQGRSVSRPPGRHSISAERSYYQDRPRRFSSVEEPIRQPEFRRGMFSTPFYPRQQDFSSRMFDPVPREPFEHPDQVYMPEEYLNTNTPAYIEGDILEAPPNSNNYEAAQDNTNTLFKHIEWKAFLAPGHAPPPLVTITSDHDGNPRRQGRNLLELMKAPGSTHDGQNGIEYQSEKENFSPSKQASAKDELKLKFKQIAAELASISGEIVATPGTAST